MTNSTSAMKAESAGFVYCEAGMQLISTSVPKERYQAVARCQKNSTCSLNLFLT